jgi:hypothetical protein
MNLRSFAAFRLLAGILGFLGLAVGALAQSSLPNATVGTAYTFTITTNPAAPAGTIYGATGLPTGLSINSSSGTISGTPTTPGAYSGTLSLTSGGVTNNYAYIMTVNAASGTPVITSTLTATGTAGQAFSFTLSASNGPTSYNVGTLPSGLSFTNDVNNPQISGTPTTAGTYTVSVSANNGSGTGASSTLTITINPAGPVPAITSATSANAALNAAFTYTITATNGPITAFAASGLPLNLSLNTSSGVISGTPTVAGVYTVALSATNSNGTGSTTNLTLTVGALSAITSTSLSATSGQAATLQLTATNSPTSFNVSGLPSWLSLTNASTGVLSGTPPSTGTFTFTVSANNTVGTGASATVTLTVSAATGGGGGGGGATAPTITTQPASLSVTAGTSATFTVAASGTSPFTYQWSKGGVAITGATSASYTIAATQTTDSGSYAVLVSNSGGSATSTSATLTVTAVVTPVSITTQPASLSVTAGSSATFTVVVTGTSPIAYQWNKNGTAISGATSSSYTISATQTADNGGYTVLVSNAGGSATSGTATLTVTVLVTPVTISTQPAAQSVAVGGSATFTVAATGTGTLTYQWYKNGLAIAGATSATLTLNSLQRADNGGVISVIVSGTSGSVTSSSVGLTVLASRLINISGRAYVGTGGQLLVVGYSVGGTGTKQALVRGVGPTLSQQSIAGPLANPRLDLFDRTSTIIATDIGWGNTPTLGPSTVKSTIQPATSSTFSQAYAFSLPSGSADSALVATLPASSIYMAQVSGVGNTTGAALAELYDLDTGTPSARFINISARAYVGSISSQFLVAGFWVSGPVPETVLIRAVGTGLVPIDPALSGQTLANPILTVYDSSRNVIATNIGWGNAPVSGSSTVGATVQPATASAFSQVYAFSLSAGSADCAMLVTLPPGGYTAQVSGVSSATGVALVEVYEFQ